MLSVLSGILVAALVIAATGGPNWGASILAAAALLAGFLGLAVTRTADAPLRPVRLALTISLILTMLLLLGLPWPPRGPDVHPFAVLATGLLLTGTVLAAVPRWPRAAVTVLALLAADGSDLFIQFGRHLTSAASVWASRGPAVALGSLVTGCLAAAWITALWHAREVWRIRSAMSERAT